MKNGVRFFLLGLVAALVLAASPVALGDGTTDQLVVPGSNGVDCVGFLVETLDGTVNGCTPEPDGVTFFNIRFSAAANGSIVFMAQDNTDPSGGDAGSIWLVKPDGSSVHLDDSTWDFDPTISYDGSKVTFARFDSTTLSSDIYTVNSDGSDLQLAVSGGGTNALTLPSISPDGSSIAYWCGPVDPVTPTGQGCGPLTDGSYREFGLMRVNVDGTDPRMIVIGGGGALESGGSSGMSWSPDGQWLALDGLLQIDLGNNESTTQRQLFEYRTDGSDLFDNLDPTRQITAATPAVPSTPIVPQFSPDGSRLLYMDTYDDNGNQGNFTYLIDIDGTNRHDVPVNYGAFIPTATPVAPPPLVDMTHITVPSVGNLDLSEATSELVADNLTVGTVSYEYSATVGQNLVVSQSPSAGSVAHRTQKQGPTVDLVVSLGAAPTAPPPAAPPPAAPPPAVVCVVPKVKGKRLGTAGPALTTAHCEVGKVKRAFSRTFKKGRVISAKPGAGRQLPDGAPVALTVSKGRRSSR